jgi:hypothetical protein
MLDSFWRLLANQEKDVFWAGAGSAASHQTVETPDISAL